MYLTRIHLDPEILVKLRALLILRRLLDHGLVERHDARLINEGGVKPEMEGFLFFLGERVHVEKFNFHVVVD